MVFFYNFSNFPKIAKKFLFNFITKRTEGNSTLKLIFVMVMVPSVMNIFQVWVQDNFLKKAEFSEDIDIALEDEAFIREVYQFKINTREKDKINVEMRGNNHTNEENSTRRELN